jgi:isocitrate lyase
VRDRHARPRLRAKFAEAIHAKFPGKMLAYNCSPSFNWKKNLDDATIAKFQRELGAMGYKFQFITLAGFHALNYSMFELAHGYARNNMSAFVELQQKEFAAAEKGFTATSSTSARSAPATSTTRTRSCAPAPAPNIRAAAAT